MRLKQKAATASTLAKTRINALLLIVSMSLIVPASSLEAATTTFSTSATTIVGIVTIREDFRAAIGGGTTAGANGSFGGLRREINWDGVPDASSSPNSLPANFFNVNSPRGVVFSTPGSGFQVSANLGIGAIEFGNINATYSINFAPFSAQRLFTPIGSNVTDVNFFVPGTAIAAFTSAFGVVFSDVDLSGSSLQFFDASNNSLGTFAVPALVGNETFAFLGVVFDTPVISRVRITSGNSALGAGINDSASIDVAVMDDLIYAEPTAAPESGSLMLLSLGIVAIVIARRLRSAA